MMRLMQTALHNNVQQPFPCVSNVLASYQEDGTPWSTQGNCKTVVTSKFWYVKSFHRMISYWWRQCPCWYCLNSSPSGQSGRHFADNLFRCIFVNEMFCILIKISLKFVPRGLTNNDAPNRRHYLKPFSEAMLTRYTDAYMRHQMRWVNLSCDDPTDWQTLHRWISS